VAAISLLIAVVTHRFRHRDDFFVGGNNFLYYSPHQIRKNDFRGPDFYYVDGVDRFRHRDYWAVWDENNRLPNLITELLSPSTAKEDRTTKKRLYERTLKIPEYYCYDPATQKLEGWRLGPHGRYRRLRPNRRGWLGSEELGLWLGTWTGEYLGLTATWLRFYDTNGHLVPLPAEEEQQRAEEERRRAAAAEAEVERLRRELDRLRQQSPRQS
jgi:Uma2 family endonuclease